MGTAHLKCRILLLFILLAAGVLFWTAEGRCGLFLEFLVDRSGSMWSPWQGKPRIQVVQEALEKVIAGLPEDCSVGLRVYPSPSLQAGEMDPGLRIQAEGGNRERVVLELRRLSPQGKDALAGHLRRALQDFPEGADSRLLILICDGADIEGGSFCSMDAFEGLEGGLEFHILTLNLEDPLEQQELDCLGKQLSGTVTHLTASARLLPTLTRICRDALERELRHRDQALKEIQARKALEEKTRLKVNFENTLDAFFATSVQVMRCTLDGRDLPLPPSPTLEKEGSALVLFDSQIAKGPHLLAIQYLIRRQETSILSLESSLEFKVEEGKSTSVRCYPKGRLFGWGCEFVTGRDQEGAL